VEVAEVESAVQCFEQITGRRPRILIAKMGQDGHDRYVWELVKLHHHNSNRSMESVQMCWLLARVYYMCNPSALSTPQQ
jgi:hypothetical protein